MMAELTGYSLFVRDCEASAYEVSLRRTCSRILIPEAKYDGGTDGIRTRDLLRDRQAC